MTEQDLDRSRPRALQPRTILVVGFALLGIYALGLMFAAGSYDAFVATLLGPILVAVSLPALSRQAAREGNRRLFWLLLTALVIKLILGAVGQIYIISKAYGGVADASLYYREGWRLAGHFRGGQFATGLHPLIGTNFIKILTGIVLTVLGPTRTGGFMFFSWLGYWGLFFFYRAFVIAVPEGRSRTYARLVFFLPSLMFWPSAIGKDAWMVLALGLIAFGSARVLTDNMWRGLAVAALGFWMALMVRPHVAALAGVGLATAYLARRPRRELRELAPVAKVASSIVVAVVAVFLVSRGNAFLRESGIEHPTDVNASLGQIYSNTAYGGSTFVPTFLTSPRRAPGAAVTVLFRPILPDATNGQELLAALEGTFLLLFTLARFRWIIRALGSVRRQPFVALTVIYTGLFVTIFSSLANFGLLVRQRSSVLPFFLVLLSVPPKRKLLPRRDERAPAKEDLLSA